MELRPTAATPPGRMKLVSGSRSSFIASISPRAGSTWRGDDAQRISLRNPRPAWRGRRRDRTIRSGCGASSRASSPLGKRGDGDADRAIGLVDVADRGHARARPWTRAMPSTSPALAGVAGAGVDLVEPDQEPQLPRRRRRAGSGRRARSRSPGTGRASASACCDARR